MMFDRALSKNPSTADAASAPSPPSLSESPAVSGPSSPSFPFSKWIPRSSASSCTAPSRSSLTPVCRSSSPFSRIRACRSPSFSFPFFRTTFINPACCALAASRASWSFATVASKLHTISSSSLSEVSLCRSRSLPRRRSRFRADLRSTSISFSFRVRSSSSASARSKTSRCRSSSSSSAAILSRQSAICSFSRSNLVATPSSSAR
mmetsp:Transcript_33712/g.77800  ORF Transcript_33712/g.77800 Transcript_33712/m.77800 type:complete len:206 (+) Transcript_33712:240-857(+)